MAPRSRRSDPIRSPRVVWFWLSEPRVIWADLRVDGHASASGPWEFSILRKIEVPGEIFRRCLLAKVYRLLYDYGTISDGNLEFSNVNEKTVECILSLTFSQRTIKYKAEIKYLFRQSTSPSIHICIEQRDSCLHQERLIRCTGNLLCTNEWIW